MRRAVTLAVALAACRRDAPAKPDPAVVDAQAPMAPAPRASLVLRQGRVIDPRTAIVVHVLAAENPRSEATDGVHAVLLDRDGTVHVHELASGKEVWSHPLKAPWSSVVAVAGHALVTGLREVHLLDLRRRSARVVAVPGGVSHPAARASDFVLVEGTKLLRRIDPTAGTLAPLATLPFDLVGFRSALQRREPTTVCAVTADLALEVACLDAGGTVVTRATVDLHRPGDPKGASFALRTIDERYVLYGTGPLLIGPVRRAAVVRLLDGVTVATAEDEVATPAIREDGSLAGLVVVLPEVRFLDPSGTLRWRRPPVNPHDESASAVVRDGRLILDVYPAISSGSALIALDEKTGVDGRRRAPADRSQRVLERGALALRRPVRVAARRRGGHPHVPGLRRRHRQARAQRLAAGRLLAVTSPAGPSAGHRPSGCRTRGRRRRTRTPPRPP